MFSEQQSIVLHKIFAGFINFAEKFFSKLCSIMAMDTLVYGIRTIVEVGWLARD